jgi:hypothetical protein
MKKDQKCLGLMIAEAVSLSLKTAIIVASGKVIKEESLGFWDGDEKRVSLNLNLNYQEVLDAWSDRGSLLADDYSLSMESTCYYVSTQQTYFSSPLSFHSPFSC